MISRAAATSADDFSGDESNPSPGGQEEAFLRSATVKYLRGNLAVGLFYEMITKRAVGGKGVEAAVLKVARGIPEDKVSSNLPRWEYVQFSPETFLSGKAPHLGNYRVSTFSRGQFFSEE